MGACHQMSKKIFEAIKQGKLDEVQRLLFLNPDLIYEKEHGLSPVMIAAYQQEPAIADFLADKTGSLNIFEAAARGKTNQIIRHLARDPMLVNAYAEDGFQPLGLACFFGHYETAEYLIKAGASINSHSNNSLKTAPIHSAAAAGYVKIVMLLLNNRADPNARDQGGCTPLHTAAQNGDTQMIRSLLFNGGDLTIRNKEGRLPVDVAIESGHADAAKLLKEGITRRFRAMRTQVSS
jgi:ankyrin repeat protein